MLVKLTHRVVTLKECKTSYVWEFDSLSILILQRSKSCWLFLYFWWKLVSKDTTTTTPSTSTSTTTTTDSSFFQTRLKWSLHIGHSLLICGKNLVYEMFESNILFFIYVNVKKSDFSKESSTSRMMKLCNDTLLLLCCRSNWMSTRRAKIGTARTLFTKCLITIEVWRSRMMRSR